jgi:hypothetical protein
MKLNRLHAFIGSVGTGILLAGCVGPKGLVLEPVGPNPATTASANAAIGTLVVYSAQEASADFNMRDTRRPEYSSYQIYNRDGSLRETVDNTSDSILQRPRRVELPPGTYRISAVANGYGLVTVPVTIQPGCDTIVHLEGGYSWPGHPAFDRSNSVRLPDGEVVGWKSQTAQP